MNKDKTFLKQIITSILDSPEMAAKRPISHIASLFDFDTIDTTQRYALPGDDCAAFSREQGFHLLASEGIQSQFLASDPWRAGWSAVMANVSDIAAMGGLPTGIVSTLWHHNTDVATTICKGIKNACDVFDITYGGGHLNIELKTQANLSVAIHGTAEQLLSCWHVRPEMSLYALTNLNGHWQGSHLYWNCLSKRTPKDLRTDWHLPNIIANQDMASAAKDISNAGVIGTLIMMAELTTYGLDIDLNTIQLPLDVDFVDWLRAFQSYGFVFCCTPNQGEKLARFFKKSHLTLQPIGRVRNDKEVNLHWKGESATMMQFDQQSLTGFSQKKERHV